MDKGIIYAPDYAINAGGIINISVELSENGYDPAIAKEKTAVIYDTTLKVLNYAEENGIPTFKAANLLAEQRIADAKAGK